VGICCADYATPSTRNVGTNFSDKRRSLGRYSSLEGKATEFSFSYGMGAPLDTIQGAAGSFLGADDGAKSEVDHSPPSYASAEYLERDFHSPTRLHGSVITLFFLQMAINKDY
jgi:hypothetical protein